MEIQGITALITGASRGIGRAIALELAENGAKRLLLVARDHTRLAEVAAAVAQHGTEAIVLPLDLTHPIAINGAIARAWRQYGSIDLLVNCAGVAHQTSFLQSRLPDVEQEIAVNLVGMYSITRSIARRMAAQRHGQIVNVSSLMGKIAAPTMATYSATKFAIVGFTQALRGELAEYNVKVSALLPSLTETDMVQELQWFRWVVPMTPHQVARALVAGLRQGSGEILVGWQSHLAVWGHRVAPWLVETLLRWAAPASESLPGGDRLHRQKRYARLRSASTTP